MANTVNPPGLPVNQIIQGDCIEVLARLPEKSVDLVFADPPYNLQLRNALRRPNNTLVDAVDDPWDQFANFQEYDGFTRNWLDACRRVLKDSGTIWVIGTYHNIYRVGAILQDLNYWILNDVAWIKSNPMPNFRGVRFTNAQETLIWAQKVRGARYTFNHRMMKSLNGDLQMRSDWYLPTCTGKERIKVNGAKAHTAQKPESLLYRVLIASTKPDDLVLDPFFGMGTTGVVAKKLRRRWLGIERDPGYVRIASQRIQAVIPAETFPEVYQDTAKKQRVPFGLLVESGLLQPGQKLYFDNRSDVTAEILPDGRLRGNPGERGWNGLVGSIHQVAKSILDGPCNGWDRWYYEIDENGERRVIDELRQQLRESMQVEKWLE